MTDRKQELKENFSTYGKKYGPAMKITDQQEANAYFGELVEHAMLVFGSSREEAEKDERSNLGYYAGYYDKDTFERVHRLFSCAHPFFGNTYPSPDEAFAAESSYGESLKKEKP